MLKLSLAASLVASLIVPNAASQDCEVLSLESPFGQPSSAVQEYQGHYYDGGIRHLNRRALAPGSQWASFGGGISGPMAGLDPQVIKMVELNGELIVAGAFVSAGGALANGVAAWNGTSFRSIGDGVNNLVREAIVWNGQLVIGGEFTSNASGSTFLDHVAVYDAATDSFQPMGGGLGGVPAGFSSGVQGLTVHQGEVHAVGRFRTSGSTMLNGIGRFDASTNSWQPVGSGVGIGGVQSGQVATGCVSFGGDLWVSGVFPSIDGVSIPSFYGIWDGSSWAEGPTNNVTGHSFTMVPLNGELYSFAINGFNFPGANIDFAVYDGQSWLPIAGANNFVFGASPNEDGSGILFGGGFDQVDGIMTGNVALLDCDSSPNNTTFFCDPVVANSTGMPSAISAQGSNVVADNDLVVTATQLPRFTFGFFITSQMQGFVANPGGSAGNLCLAGSIGRYVGPGQVQNSGATGSIALDIDLGQVPQPNGAVAVAAGESWNFQLWHRDSAPSGPTSNFSGGVSILFE